MIIEIENTSSPGASFTENTNRVILNVYDWICEHRDTQLLFIEFRKKLESEKSLNDNNNRNIFPLLRNCGLVDYEKKDILNVEKFFTNTGKAYVKALQTENEIEKLNISNSQKVEVTNRIQNIKKEIIYESLLKLMQNKSINYNEPFKNLIAFIIEYNKINKIEFAMLLNELKEYNLEIALEHVGSSISEYRNGQIDIEVQVKVRNDVDVRYSTSTIMRKESLSFLTSWGYFTGLLCQAGLITEKEGYFYICDDQTERLINLKG